MCYYLMVFNGFILALVISVHPPPPQKSSRADVKSYCVFLFPGKGRFPQLHVRYFFLLQPPFHHLAFDWICYLYWNFEMQIMIYWDNMLYLLNIQLYHLLVILVHILLTLDRYIPRPPTLVELFQKILTFPTGMVHPDLVTCQPPTHILQ